MPHDPIATTCFESNLSLDALSDLYIGQHHRLKRIVDEAMQAVGLSLARAKVLDRLRVHGPLRQQSLAEAFGFAPRSITDMVDGLERDGLAERLDDPSDRRAKLVRITASGTDALAAALRVRNDLIQHIFGTLTPADRVELARLLTAIDGSLATIPKESNVFSS